MFPDFSILAEDAAYLWLSRSFAIKAAHTTLLDVVRFDERVEAHLEAVAVAARCEHAAAEALFASTGQEAVFVGVSAHIRAGRFEPLSDYIASGQMSSGGLSALAWAGPGSATTLPQRLLLSADPLHVTAGIAVSGMRRSDPGEHLARGMAAESSALRARAYRTAGQLGRADLMAQFRPGLTDEDPECRFWSAWAAARMGAGEEALGVLAEIAWTNQPRAVRALDLLLRRLEVPHANAWLRAFAKLPDRQRDLIRATGVVGDPIYIPWLIERMAVPETARLAGEAFSMITGLDLAYRDLDRKPPRDFESGPNDDPADENVALDDDENLPWPDPGKIGDWWLANLAHYQNGNAYFLGSPKPAADWIGALSDAYQRQRHAAALELAIRMPRAAMFEVRARGRLQRQLIARARGLA